MPCHSTWCKTPTTCNVSVFLKLGTPAPSLALEAAKVAAIPNPEKKHYNNFPLNLNGICFEASAYLKLCVLVVILLKMWVRLTGADTRILWNALRRRL